MTAANITEYAFVSLGSNLPSGKGDCLATLAFAESSLAGLTDSPLLKSPVYVTSPVDSPAGTPDFFNMAIALLPRTGETPLSFLRQLQAIENNAGRQRTGIRNEARTLDLDLVSFGRETCNTPALILPHPRAHERRFVLEPMMAIAGGDFVLPGMTQSLRELLENLAGRQVIRKV